MIIINLIEDLLIANLTIFPTYFILINIFKVPLRYSLIIILIALFLDIYVLHCIFNIIILPILYILLYKKKISKLSQNILFNSISYLLYISSLYLLFNYNQIDCLYLAKYLLFNYPLYLIYVLISYKIQYKS